MPHVSEIQIRDPFVVPVVEEGRYYLFGTTDKNPWEGPGTGFDCYWSTDLVNFEGPMEAFRPAARFWGSTNFWAPEVHRYRGRWFMFASFKHEGVPRGTQVLVADRVSGPYVPHTPRAITPAEWECLDGTLFVDREGLPWMVFCHEWVQIGDGAMYAMRLNEDLTAAAGEPLLLFNASQAGWVEDRLEKKHHVTDGPFLYRMANKSLAMLWSTGTPQGYALGVAVSTSGLITGPWHHEHEPLFRSDGGHGMLFRRFDELLMLAIHHPNVTPNERVLFVRVKEQLMLGGRCELVVM